jgi:hypothetical protein
MNMNLWNLAQSGHSIISRNIIYSSGNSSGIPNLASSIEFRIPHLARQLRYDHIHHLGT